MLNYLEAILRVYNRYGRRDNKYKARIKILVKERDADEFAREVEAEWAHLAGGPATVTDEEFERVAAHFTAAAVRARSRTTTRAIAPRSPTTARFATGSSATSTPHKVPGYAVVTLSLKRTGVPPGDVDRRPDGRGGRSRRRATASASCASRTSRT